MEVKLYVGNLAYATTEDELRELFSQAGTVKSVAIIKDRETGQSKGFGFVEMATQAEAQSAITMFHNKQFHERALTVNVARPREERGDRGPGGPRGGGDRDRRGGGSGRPSGGRDRERRSSW